MDAILHTLNAWRESQFYSLPILRVAGVFVLGLCWGGALAVLQPEDVLADIRAALRHAGLTDKEVTSAFAVNRSNCGERLRGERPLTIQKLAMLPVEFWQWWAVATAVRHGVPAPVTTGARLARRQARISLASNEKAGVA